MWSRFGSKVVFALVALACVYTWGSLSLRQMRGTPSPFVDRAGFEVAHCSPLNHFVRPTYEWMPDADLIAAGFPPELTELFKPMTGDLSGPREVARPHDSLLQVERTRNGMLIGINAHAGYWLALLDGELPRKIRGFQAFPEQIVQFGALAHGFFMKSWRGTLFKLDTSLNIVAENPTKEPFFAPLSVEPDDVGGLHLTSFRADYVRIRRINPNLEDAVPPKTFQGPLESGMHFYWEGASHGANLHCGERGRNHRRQRERDFRADRRGNHAAAAGADPSFGIRTQRPSSRALCAGRTDRHGSRVPVPGNRAGIRTGPSH